MALHRPQLRELGFSHIIHARDPVELILDAIRIYQWKGMCRKVEGWVLGLCGNWEGEERRGKASNELSLWSLSGSMATSSGCGCPGI